MIQKEKQTIKLFYNECKFWSKKNQTKAKFNMIILSMSDEDVN